MPRRPIVRSHEHYYHITARSNNRESFYLPIEEVWALMVRNLHLLQLEFDLKIGAFVLMNNHFHLLLLTPTADLDRVMYFFMKNVTKELQKRTGRINKIFGGRYKGCLIQDHKYLMNALKYVYRNPLRANLVASAEKYPFSTLGLQKTGLKVSLQIEEIIENISCMEFSKWVNSDFHEVDPKRIKWGLSRTVFQLKKKK